MFQPFILCENQVWSETGEKFNHKHCKSEAVARKLYESKAQAWVCVFRCGNHLIPTMGIVLGAIISHCDVCRHAQFSTFPSHQKTTRCCYSANGVVSGGNVWASKAHATAANSTSAQFSRISRNSPLQGRFRRADVSARP